MEAEERNRRAKVTNVLKRELAAIENNIAELETQKSAHQQRLCDPQIHKNPSKIKELQMGLKTVENDLKNAYHTWTELSGRLEEILPVHDG